MSTARLLSRRRLVAFSVAASAAALAVPVGRAFARQPAERWLELANTHTGEVLRVAYRSEDGLVAPALGRLQHLLRDHRVNEEHAIDPGLYDQLADLAVAAGREPRYEVISGYRSPRTNAALAERSTGVATRSLHLEGRAIDVRLQGCGCERLRDLALAAGRGGVGFYGRSDFVHLDTGRVRAWTG
jgi:uncharacterized protein YcbK (DUF882 family)